MYRPDQGGRGLRAGVRDLPTLAGEEYVYLRALFAKYTRTSIEPNGQDASTQYGYFLKITLSIMNANPFSFYSYETQT